jgi:hypothetical protein
MPMHYAPLSTPRLQRRRVAYERRRRSSKVRRPHDAAYSSRASPRWGSDHAPGHLRLREVDPPSVERERPLHCSALRPEPPDCAEVGPADHDRRCADGAEGSKEHGADASRGSHRRGVPPEDAIAAGGRAGLPEGYHCQSQPERPAPLPPAAWELKAACESGCDACRLAGLSALVATRTPRNSAAREPSSVRGPPSAQASPQGPLWRSDRCC